MSQAVDEKALEIVESPDNNVRKIVVTGKRMGHVVSFPKLQQSYIYSIAPDIPVENVGGA